jgi:hypothetical protein
MSKNIDAQLVCDALMMALWRRKFPQNVIVHSDRGSQYASHMFRDLLKKYSLTQSMSRKGDCWDHFARRLCSRTNHRGNHNGPVVQYVGAVEKYDYSLLGENALIYKTYDDNILETLANGGDVLAIKVLADQLISNMPDDDPNLTSEENRKCWDEYKQKKKIP